MNTLKLQVSSNIIKVTQCPKIITSGTVGFPVEISFDDSWKDLDRVVLFRADDVTVTTKDPTVIPWEVLEKPRVYLQIGVYGINADGTYAIPTMWTSVCMISVGTDPEADPAMDPTLPIWQDLMNRVEDLEDSGNGVVCEATPETLADIIANAQPNTTINLSAGKYELLTLNGKTSYPENLTIVGCDGATVSGVSITSGVKTTDALNNSDILEALMPNNLTFKGVQFSDSFCVRNSEITGLTLHNCEFLTGACLKVRPNRPSDDYGNDGSATMSSFNYYATRIAHDVTVSGCHFLNANKESTSTAIYMESVDNVTIHGNRVDNASYDGIQIVGRVTTDRYDAPVSGRIAITSNTIRNTGSYSIRLNRFENADILVLYNKLHSVSYDECEYIKITGFDSTTRVFTKFYSGEAQEGVEVNYYEGDRIGVGFGITLEQEQTSSEKIFQEHIDSNSPHPNLKFTAEQVGAVPKQQYEDEFRGLEKDFQSHLIADNPHNLDYAPGGFGLGVIPTPSVKWNASNRPGFFRSKVDAPDSNSWWGITTATDGGYGAHIAFSRTDGILTEAKRLYKTSSKVCSGDWEYVNPPMQLNKEYRTTERFLGQPVYVMVMNFGTLPSMNGTKRISLAPKDVTVVDMYGIASYTDDSGNAIYYPISCSPDTPEFYIDTTNGWVFISSKVDLSARTAKIIIKYIKN